MKIGLVCPYSVTKGGGVQEVVKALQTEYEKQGHEAVIITPQPNEPYNEHGRKVIFLGTATDFRSPLATTTQISASVLTDEIDAMLEYEKFDVLHFHEPWVPVLSRQILSRSKTVNVATFHAKLPETITSRALAKIVTPYTKPLLRHIHHFTAVSDAAADYVKTLTDEPIEIVPNGIHINHFRKPANLQRPRAPKTILYIGRLEKRKGLKYLLQAMKLLQEQAPNVRLLIGGDGVDREKLEEYSEELKLHNVEFLGYLEDVKKRELLHTADLFCSPAIFGESFGIVLLEAMSSGIVTVAGNNPGYSAVMTGLGQLSLVDPRDTQEFAHRLNLLLQDEGIRELWKKWAKKHVRQFDYPKVAAKYIDVYERAMTNYEIDAPPSEEE